MKTGLLKIASVNNKNDCSGDSHRYLRDGEIVDMARKRSLTSLNS